MPSYSQVYDFETQMETAIASAITLILTSEGITAPVSITRSAETNDTPRVEVTFSPGNALAQRTAIGQANPKQVPNAFEGSLNVKIITCRSLETNNSDLHGTIRGWVRYVLSAGARGLNTTILPYLQILEMLPAGASAQIYDEKQQDITEMTYNVFFSIRNEAWPTVFGRAFSEAFSAAFS